MECMRTRKGRAVAYATATVCLTVLALFLFSFRKTLLEQWYLRRLRTDDEASRNAAAEKLADIGSVKAIPCLLRMPGETEFNLTFSGDHDFALTVLGDYWRLQANHLSSDVTGTLNSRLYANAPLERIVRLSGKAAVPYLRAGLLDSDQAVRLRTAMLLLRTRLADKINFALPLLEETLKLRDDPLIRGLLKIAKPDC